MIITADIGMLIMYASPVQLDIVGHSGDSDEVPFVNSSNPPCNDKERLQVLKVRESLLSKLSDSVSQCSILLVCRQ